MEGMFPWVEIVKYNLYHVVVPKDMRVCVIAIDRRVCAEISRR